MLRAHFTVAVNYGFTSHLYQVITAALKLVKHFNHSTIATKALESKLQQMKLPAHWSCKMRWNSVRKMSERLLEQC